MHGLANCKFESSHIQSDILMCCKGTLVCFVTLHTLNCVMWCWELPFQHLTESATSYGVTWFNLPQTFYGLVICIGYRWHMQTS